MCKAHIDLKAWCMLANTPVTWLVYDWSHVGPCRGRGCGKDWNFGHAVIMDTHLYKLGGVEQRLRSTWDDTDPYILCPLPNGGS